MARPALIRAWIVWWLLCAALWMVLDDTVATAELVDGAVAAAIGASGATLGIARGPALGTPRPRWVRYAWRPLIQLVTDLPPLVGALGAALSGGSREPGQLRRVPFAVDADPNVRTAQVALASVAGSFAPNTVVLAVDEESQELIVHELVPRSSRSGADPLELG